jgi:hypothetical protein
MTQVQKNIIEKCEGEIALNEKIKRCFKLLKGVE